MTKIYNHSKMLAQANKKEKNMKLTNSQEEYLKTIYLLQKNNKKIRVTDIANKLKITKPSVNKAIKALKELELINYETYGEITLTKKAEEIAENIIKRQDIIEMFLVHILELDHKKAVEEAKSIKHAMSEETTKKLEKYITKILNLQDLECGYDVSNEKCRKCVRITVRNKNRECKRGGK